MAILLSIVCFGVFMLVFVHHGVGNLRRWEKLIIYTGAIGSALVVFKNKIEYPIIVSAAAVGFHFFVGNIDVERPFQVFAKDEVEDEEEEDLAAAPKIHWYQTQRVNEIQNFFKSMSLLDRWIYGLLLLTTVVLSPGDVAMSMGIFLFMRTSTVISFVRRDWSTMFIFLILVLMVICLLVVDWLYRMVVLVSVIVSVEVFLALWKCGVRVCGRYCR